MFLYTLTEAILGAVVGILLAACTKKADGVTYGKLDKAGRIVNILLIPVYVCLSPLYLFLGMISSPRHEGLLGIAGIGLTVGLYSLFAGNLLRYLN